MRYLLIVFFFFNCYNALAQRKVVLLHDGWRTIANDGVHPIDVESKEPTFNDQDWKVVRVPHNWDQYEGYRRMLHGNRHGEAFYRKHFSVGPLEKGKHYFLYFQGVGSYATVYVNGMKAAYHAGGRTGFTVDVTSLLYANGQSNLIAVHVQHPSGIKDLPWVCGGCSNERGFSEGSQPMGIFRSVQLVVTNAVRIEPFGVHTWSETDKKNIKTTLHLNATLKNYSGASRQIVLQHRLMNAQQQVVRMVQKTVVLKGGDSVDISVPTMQLDRLQLWSTDDPYLYSIQTKVIEKGRVVDAVSTPYGFRTFSWNAAHQLELNGKPVFINGIAEYEHLMGKSHAFEDAQIRTRMQWITKAGFNALRDAHQPHPLLYGQLCDEKGLLWWTQFSAHVWYDSPLFREQFKTLLREWVLERRNQPSLFLWGLQNESQLPEDFAKECSDIIRRLDPTASSQRLITTCNGGSGTDWDVPQNWTGTYGGDPSTYAQDLKKQVLVGEYGAWRTLDLHSEGPFQQNGIYSEDRITQLIGQKIALAESVKDSVGGHFFWLLSSHENPGRMQGGEALRELDRVGPVNYKGMLTPWEEPTDLFYLFRSSYVSAKKEPMVYIVSHTWPNRWEAAGEKNGIRVFSNCDSVELFNGIEKRSLGRKANPGKGKAFQWDHVMIQSGLLYATGYVQGKAVVRDSVDAGMFGNVERQTFNVERSTSNQERLTSNVERQTFNSVFRVNCGGPDYVDASGQRWSADQTLNVERSTFNVLWGSRNWTDAFPSMPAFFGSQRRIFDPVDGTNDPALFQDFRYGVQELSYQFPLPDGNYQVELYFAEPWLGNGGGWNAKGMRMFDVAFNDQVVLKDLDIWSEAGTRHALKKTIPFTVKGGMLKIHFPHAASGEALIAAIAIGIVDKVIVPPLPQRRLLSNTAPRTIRAATWVDLGATAFADTTIRIHTLPTDLFGATILKPLFKNTNTSLSFNLAEASDIYICIAAKNALELDHVEGFLRTSMRIKLAGVQDSLCVYKQRIEAGTRVHIGQENSMMLRWPVFAQAASDLQPAFDLKSVQSFKANGVTPVEGTAKVTIDGKEYLQVMTDDAVEIHWPWKTGVADRYSLTLKYAWSNVKDIYPSIHLQGAGYRTTEDKLQPFTFTKFGKWNVLNFTTGSMVNAGNYEMVIRVQGAKGLVLNGIDVQ